MKYYSNAKWTKIPASRDDHDTREYAEWICQALLNDYGIGTRGCDIRGNCVETWVTEENE